MKKTKELAKKVGLGVFVPKDHAIPDPTQGNNNQICNVRAHLRCWLKTHRAFLLLLLLSPPPLLFFSRLALPDEPLGDPEKQNQKQSEKPIDLKFPVKGAMKSKEQPKFRQVGNSTKPKSGFHFLNLGVGDTYLVCRVIRAKVKSQDENKEDLQPCVFVDFAGVRKTTRVCCVMPSHPFPGLFVLKASLSFCA